MEAILFDWDGTLVDSLGAFHRGQRDRDGGVRAAVRRRPSTAATTRPTGARCTAGSASPATGSTRPTACGRRRSAATATSVVAVPRRARRPRAAAGRRRGRSGSSPPAIGPSSSRSSSGPGSARSCRSASSATTWRSTSPIPSRSGWPSGWPATAIDRRPRSTSATRRRTCRWRSPSAPAPVGIESVLGDPGRAARGRGARRSRRRSRRGSDRPPRGRRPRPRRPAARMTLAAAGHALDPRRRHVVPDRRDLDAAWPGWSDGDRPRDRRRRRRPPCAPASAGAIDLWVGDGDSLGEAGAGRARRRGRPDPAVAGRQGRVGHRARAPGRRRAPARGGSRSSARSAASGSTTASPTSGCSAIRRLGRPATSASLDATVRIRLVGPGPGRPRRPDRRPRLAPAIRRRRRRAHDRRASATRSATSRCRAAVARPVERPRWPRDASLTVGSGRILVVETPATLSRMSMPEAGDLAPEIALPDETGTVHRLSRPARPLDDRLLLPEGRHARLHRRGLRVPRRQRDDPRARRRRLGDQPPGRGEQARVPREVRPAVHPPRRRGSRRRRRLRLVGREGELRQDVHGRRPDDVPRRSRRPDRPDLAEGQAGGPRRRGDRRARRGPGGRRRERALNAPPDARFAPTRAVGLKPVRPHAGHGVRLRSWGETSEASAGMIALPHVAQQQDHEAERRR